MNEGHSERSRVERSGDDLGHQSLDLIELIEATRRGNAAQRQFAQETIQQQGDSWKLPNIGSSTEWSVWYKAYNQSCRSLGLSFFVTSEYVEDSIKSSRAYRRLNDWLGIKIAESITCVSTLRIVEGIENAYSRFLHLKSTFGSPSNNEPLAMASKLLSLRDVTPSKIPTEMEALVKSARDCHTGIDDLLKAFAVVLCRKAYPDYVKDWMKSDRDVNKCLQQLKLNIALDADYNRKTTLTTVESRDIKPRTFKICSHCKKPGHDDQVCWSLHPDKIPARLRDRPKPDSKSTVLAVGSDVETRETNHGSEFRLDCGSDVHLVNDMNLLRDVREINKTLTTASGSLNATHSGILDIDDPLKRYSALELTDVVYSPDTPVNVISVGQLERAGYRVIFRSPPHPVRVMDGDCSALEFERVGTRFVGTFGQCDLSMPDNAVIMVSAKQDAKLWHNRLGHFNMQVIRNTLRCKKLIVGKGNNVCNPCLSAKMGRSVNKSPATRANAPGDRIHVDLGGGQQSLAGMENDKVKMFMLVTDDFSRYRWVYLLNAKSKAPEHLMQFVALFRTQFDKPIKVLRSDGGGEFSASRLQTFLRDNGIIWEPTAAAAPEQDGVSKRRMRTVMERVRAMLSHAKLPAQLWPLAMDAAIYIINRCVMKSESLSPFEKLFGAAPEISHIRTFGCIAMCRDTSHKSKLAPRAKEMILVGHLHPNIYLLLNPWTGQVVKRRDVAFDENRFAPRVPFLEKSRQQTSDLVDYSVPAFYTDQVLAVDDGVPKTYIAALRSRDATAWQQAMNDEIASLVEMDTWECVNRNDIGNARVLDGKWVFRVKENGTFRPGGSCEAFRR